MWSRTDVTGFSSPSSAAPGVTGGRRWWTCRGRRGVVPLTHGGTATLGLDNTTQDRSAQDRGVWLRRWTSTRTSSHVRLSTVPDVDATDARLLLALGEDPRASVMALSHRLGLARNTVQTRLARLESNGVLAPLDRRGRPPAHRDPPARDHTPPGVPRPPAAAPEALGYRLSAYVTVQVVQRSLADVSGALAQIPEVVEVTGLSGVADLLVEVVAKDADDLWRITEQLLAIPGIQRTDTALALRRFVDHRLGPLLERAAGEDAGR